MAVSYFQIKFKPIEEEEGETAHSLNRTLWSSQRSKTLNDVVSCLLCRYSLHDNYFGRWAEEYKELDTSFVVLMYMMGKSMFTELL